MTHDNQTIVNNKPTRFFFLLELYRETVATTTAKNKKNENLYSLNR